MDLIQEIIKRQKDEKLSNRQFAKKLGISRGMWDAVVNGKRNAGWKVWGCIGVTYPDLTDYVLDLVDAKALSQGVKHGDSNRRTQKPTPTKTRRMQEVSRHNGLPR